LEELTRVIADLRALHDFLKPKGPGGTRTLPDNWLPIPHKVEFPHPYMLDRLTPTSIGCAVVRLSERDKKKEPFIDLGEVKVGRSRIPFQVDYLNRQQNEICAEILAQIPSRSKATQKEISGDVVRQLLQLSQRKSRERKTKDGHLFGGMVVRAMEIYLSCLGDRPLTNLNDLSLIERKKALDVVAKKLFPIEYTNKRKAVLQRVRHYIKNAYDASDRLIA
jgi:hypothetical protein